MVVRVFCKTIESKNLFVRRVRSRSIDVNAWTAIATKIPMFNTKTKPTNLTLVHYYIP